MRKIYLLATSILASATLFGQSNLSFEDWDAGAPVDWDYYGSGNTMNDFMTLGTVEDQNGDPVTPIVEMTDVPTDGDSYVRMTSFELSGSSDPANVPDGEYGSLNYQLFASTDKLEDVSFDVKYDILGSDEAVLFVQANDASGDLVGQGYIQLTGSQGAFSTETVAITYFESDPVAAYEIIIASSINSVFATLGGNPTPTPEPGSVLDVDNIVLGDVLQDAPNVTNLTATVIDDNCNGTDLQATFEVPDETNIENYYLLVTSPGINPALLPDPLAVFQGLGVQLTPDGSDKTHVFAAGDEYFNSTTEDWEVIGDDEDLVVHVLVQGAAGYENVFSVSNTVNLDCEDDTANLLEVDKNKVRLYPNPASETVNFDFGNNVVETITVSSINGQTVATINPSNSEATLDVTGLDNGVYFFNAVDNAGNIVKTDKFVVSH